MSGRCVRAAIPHGCNRLSQVLSVAGAIAEENQSDLAVVWWWCDGDGGNLRIRQAITPRDSCACDSRSIPFVRGRCLDALSARRPQNVHARRLRSEREQQTARGSRQWATWNMLIDQPGKVAPDETTGPPRVDDVMPDAYRESGTEVELVCPGVNVDLWEGSGPVRDEIEHDRRGTDAVSALPDDEPSVLFETVEQIGCRRYGRVDRVGDLGQRERLGSASDDIEDGGDSSNRSMGAHLSSLPHMRNACQVLRKGSQGGRMQRDPYDSLVSLLDLHGIPVDIAGGEPATVSPHRLAECMAAVMAANGAAGSRLATRRGGPARAVAVRTDDALLQLMAVYATRLGAVRAVDTMEDPHLLGDGDFYRCRDGREIFLLLSYPHLRDRALQVLGCPPGREAITQAVGRWAAADLEDAITAIGGTATMVRGTDEWAASAPGRALANTPVVHVTRTGPAAPRQHVTLGPADPPLRGMRVLDLTHVIAGPIAARLAAELGADVLHLSRPDRPDPNAMILETGRGKRNAFSDLRTPAGRSALEKLLESADVVLHSYRNLARFGLDAEQLAANHPGIVFADVHGWGADGPWAERGGFDQLACAATGFALEEGGTTAALPPTYLLNDYVAAFLLSAGIQTALTRQIIDGGSWHTHVDLARVCTWVQDQGINTARIEHTGGDLRASLNGAALVSTVGPFGPVSYLPSQIRVTPSWSTVARPAAPLGSSAPVWSETDQWG